jgi:outer membrane immunogenic protein
MKKALVSLAAGAALAATAGVANADGYGYGSVKDAPLAAPQANWNGLYIGAAVGYGIATTEVEAGEYEGFPVVNLDGLSSEGLQGTITVGYDRQIHPNWVLGIFADYSLGELETDISVPIFVSAVEATIKDSWAIGARVGYINSCCTMWYVTAGYAHADVDLKGFFTIYPISLSENMDGWFIGGGVEHQLSNNLFLKLDYRYTDYDKVTWAPAEAEGYLDTETDVHSIRLGLNWKVDLFGGHHAAPAYDSLK